MLEQILKSPSTKIIFDPDNIDSCLLAYMLSYNMAHPQVSNGFGNVVFVLPSAQQVASLVKNKNGDREFGLEYVNTVVIGGLHLSSLTEDVNEFILVEKVSDGMKNIAIPRLFDIAHTNTLIKLALSRLTPDWEVWNSMSIRDLQIQGQAIQREIDYIVNHAIANRFLDPQTGALTTWAIYYIAEIGEALKKQFPNTLITVQEPLKPKANSYGHKTYWVSGREVPNEPALTV